MKLPVVFIILTVVTFGWWARGNEVKILTEEKPHGKPKFKHLVAADFTSCPNGHKELKDVHIIHGNVGPLIKRPEQFNDEDRKLAAQREKGEVAFGGDIIWGNSPKTRVRCRTCGFEYHPSDLPIEFPDDGFWINVSKDQKQFKRQFSKRLLSFPVFEDAKKSVHFSQSFKKDGKFLDSEGISFETDANLETSLKAIQEWLISQKRNPKHIKQGAEDEGIQHVFEYDVDGLNVVFLNVTQYNEPKNDVSITLNYEKHKNAKNDANKSTKETSNSHKSDNGSQ